MFMCASSSDLLRVMDLFTARFPIRLKPSLCIKEGKVTKTKTLGPVSGRRQRTETLSRRNRGRGSKTSLYCAPCPSGQWRLRNKDHDPRSTVVRGSNSPGWELSQNHHEIHSAAAMRRGKVSSRGIVVSARHCSSFPLFPTNLNNPQVFVLRSTAPPPI